MKGKTEIINSKVVGYQGLQKIIINEDNFIEKIVTMPTNYSHINNQEINILDIKGDWLSLGGIDLQING
jgi:N-acetylglucosamine-6-phosphate deacetylase